MLLHKVTMSSVGWEQKDYGSDLPTRNMLQLMICQLLLFTREVSLGFSFICQLYLWIHFIAGNLFETTVLGSTMSRLLHKAPKNYLLWPRKSFVLQARNEGVSNTYEIRNVSQDSMCAL